ncbi:MAG: molybdate ABC transporter substrate-binding protein [Alphaproteobacteria bacterium]|jgi:molybdate transport system substrate-binding protein
MALGFIHQTIHRARAWIPRVALALLFCCAVTPGNADESDRLVIFAAASTTEAVAAVATAFSQETGIAVAVSHASSASLARQIEHGAPADIYLSANDVWVDYLTESDLIVPGTAVIVAANSLVVIAPVDDAVEEDADWARTLFNALGEGGWLALGDPAHVPAGVYAREALERAGIWQALESRTARTADVRGALILVARGEAPAGLVYTTDALISSDVRIIAAVPDGLHAPIVYVAAEVTGGNHDAASQFLDMLAGPLGAMAFGDAGFLPAP